MPVSWRDASLDFYEIGKAMTEIDQAMRDARATAAVKDVDARLNIYFARRSARKLERALDSLYRKVEEKK